MLADNKHNHEAATEVPERGARQARSTAMRNPSPSKADTVPEDQPVRHTWDETRKRDRRAAIFATHIVSHPKDWTVNGPYFPAETGASLHVGVDLHFRQSGRRQLEFSPVKILVRHVAKSSQIYPKWPKLFELAPKLVEVPSKLSDFAQNLVEIAQFWQTSQRNCPKSSQIWPMSPEIRRNRTRIGQCVRKLVKRWPMN